MNNYVNQNNNYNILKNGVSQFDYVYTKQSTPPSLNGSPYLLENWSLGAFQMKGKVYDMSAIQYNVLEDKLEFKFEDGIRVINGYKVESFKIYNNKIGKEDSYVRCTSLTKVNLIGFCQALSEGQVMLLKHPEAFIKTGNYNTALMVGEKDETIVHKVQYFLIAPEFSKPIKYKKDVIDFFAQLGFDAKKFIKSEKLDVKEEADLLKLVNYYNLSVKK